HYRVRPVGGVRPDLWRPVTLLRCREPGRAVDYAGRIDLIHREVTRHAVTVRGLQAVARTSLDARNLQDLGYVLVIVDTIECILVFGGNVHLHQVDVWRARILRHLSSSLRFRPPCAD